MGNILHATETTKLQNSWVILPDLTVILVQSDRPTTDTYPLLHHPWHLKPAWEDTEPFSCLEVELQHSQADAGINQMLQGNVEGLMEVVMR
jgi:hypothetical protein